MKTRASRILLNHLSQRMLLDQSSRLTTRRRGKIKNRRSKSVIRSPGVWFWNQPSSLHRKNIDLNNLIKIFWNRNQDSCSCRHNKPTNMLWIPWIHYQWCRWCRGCLTHTSKACSLKSTQCLRDSSQCTRWWSLTCPKTTGWGGLC